MTAAEPFSQAHSQVDPDSGRTLTLKLSAQKGYLPGIPVLVRVEARQSDGARERTLWNAEATLAADQPGIVLSTNLIVLMNGLGSALVVFTGGVDFELSATVGSLRATRELVSLAQAPQASVGGVLTGSATTWSGVVRIKNDVTVPAGHELNIAPNSLLLMDGAPAGTAGASLIVEGSLQSLGTEAEPVTITCAETGLRWGQIRHQSQQLSSAPRSRYSHTSITRAGRARGEGHTGTAPAIRATSAKLSFISCSFTDLAETARTSEEFGLPGKVMMARDSELVFEDCLMARARMGPEVAGTSVLCSNSWILDMRGPDDADGFYVHDQSPGQVVRFAHCVIAQGDDDGIDTLGSVVSIEQCIVRDWANRLEDAKGVSVFNGATHIRRSLIVNCTVGVGAKWSTGPTASVAIDHSTVIGLANAVWANRKSNAPGPYVRFDVSNSLLRGQEAVLSDFSRTNFTIRFCNTSQSWEGQGNQSSDPLFQNEAGGDYRLKPFSPCIDTADALSERDPDGSPADIGYFVFTPPSPRLERLSNSAGNTFQFSLDAYTNRNYAIEASTDLISWELLKTVWQFERSADFQDKTAANAPRRFYRARLGQNSHRPL